MAFLCIPERHFKWIISLVCSVVQHARAPITVEDVPVRQVVFICALICKHAKKEHHINPAVDGIVSDEVCRDVQHVGNGLFYLLEIGCVHSER